MPPDKRLAGKVCLNLGSGPEGFPGWINVDAVKYDRVDLVHDLHKPLPYDDCSVDAVHAAQILEHINYRLAGYILNDWVRVLRIGGYIQVETPDLAILAANYLYDRKQGYLHLVQMLYGGTDESWLNVHQNAVDFEWLRSQLRYHGCDEVQQLQHSEAYVLSVLARKQRTVVIERPQLDLWMDKL